jgi:hypothetical protein
MGLDPGLGYSSQLEAKNCDFSNKTRFLEWKLSRAPHGCESQSWSIIQKVLCSMFGHSLCLLFYISSSGKGTFCDTVLLQSAISLVSSSNTWYLREIKWESWSGPGNGCHRRYCQVMTKGRDHLSFYGRMNLITETQAGWSRRWHPQQCREHPLELSVQFVVQDSGPLSYPLHTTQQLVVLIIFLLILFILTKSRTFCTSWCWVF